MEETNQLDNDQEMLISFLFKCHTDEDLKKELERLASNIFIDLDTLKNICESNELDFAKIEEQVKIELYWNSLIFEIYKHNLSINQTVTLTRRPFFLTRAAVT